MELMADDSGSEEETVRNNRKRKVNSAHLLKLQQVLSCSCDPSVGKKNQPLVFLEDS